MNNALNDIIDAKYERCVERAVYRMRRVPAKDWDSTGSPLRTLWDHWKREMQEEQSIMHDLIEQTVEGVAQQVINELSHEDGALMTLATDALDDLDDEPSEPIFAPEAVAAELMERINSRACEEPHNRQVQRLLDRQAMDRFQRDIEPY